MLKVCGTQGEKVEARAEPVSRERRWMPSSTVHVMLAIANRRAPRLIRSHDTRAVGRNGLL